MRIAILFFTFLVIVSCKKDETTWVSEYAVPAAFGTIKFSDIINDSNYIVNSDNTLNLHIERSIYELTIDSILDIPDTTIRRSEASNTPIELNVNPGFPILSNPTENVFDLNGPELKYFKLKSGFLHYKLISYIDGPSVDTIIINSASKNGNIFTAGFSMEPYANGIPAEVTGIEDLSGYEFDLTGPNGNSYNTLISSIKATVDPNHVGTVAISIADSVVIEVSFVDIVPEFAIGYFGSQQVNLSDSTSLPFLQNITSGNINLNDLNLSLTIENGIGADLQVELNDIVSSGNTDLSLVHPTIGSTINIGRALNVAGTTTPTYHSIDFLTSNSNLEQWVENLPNKVNYDISLNVNPFGDISSHNDFFDYQTPLKVNMELDMPLCFSAQNLSFMDTLDIEMDIDSNGIESGKLTFIIENWFPFEAEIQIYLTNQNGQLTDSVISNGAISPGIEDVSNIVTTPIESTIVMQLTKEQITTLSETNQIRIKLILNSNNAPSDIKLYEHYKMDYRVFTNVKYQYSL